MDKYTLVVTVASMNSGIYMIQSPSGGVYIGSSVRLKFRKTRHMSDLRHRRHPTEALQRAWIKYGGDLNFHVLEYCENERLIEREQWWIDYILGTAVKLYNSRKTADTAGQPLQESTKQKISERVMGRKKSEETKQRMRKPKSVEHAAAISRGRKGTNNIIWTDEEREKRRIATKAQHASGRRAHVGAKISAAFAVRRANRDPVREHMDRLNWILAG